MLRYYREQVKLNSKLTLTVTLTLTDKVMLTSRWEIIYASKLEDYRHKNFTTFTQMHNYYNFDILLCSVDGDFLIGIIISDRNSRIKYVDVNRIIKNSIT